MYGQPSQPIRPSRRWYWLAIGSGALAVVLIVLAVIGFVSLTTQIQSFPRVQVPGQGTLTFSGTGQYLLYFEGPGFGSSSPSSHGSVPLALESQATGQQITINHLQGQSDFYNLGGHSGTAVGSFTIVTPGRYTLRAGQPTNPSLQDIAVGRGFVSSIVYSLIELVIGIVAFIAGVVVTIVVAVRRSMYRRRLLVAGSPYMPPPGMPYPTGYPTQYPAGGPTQYPAGPAQYPAGGPQQYPAGGSEQYPAGGPAQYPAGTAPQYPAGGAPQYPAGGEAQYPAGGAPQYPADGPAQSAYRPPADPEQQPPSGQDAGPGLPPPP